jgi:mannose-1-phosphate guanylyltransferase
MYAVVMAGGGGTRLWPLSTPERPKPFIPLLGEETLFQRTVRRLLEGDELQLEVSDVFVVTDRRYGSLVRRQAPGVTVVEEPAGRNTAAAIALATVTIDRPADDVMVVLPADHAIRDEPVFRGVLRDAATLAGGAFGVESPLVTLGIGVDRPATEYGYLIPDLARGRSGALTSYPLQAFEEKPTLDRATALVRHGAGVAWNAGMFLWRRRAIWAAFRDYAPDVLDSVAGGHTTGRLAEAYADVRATSIDYAVMESAAADGRVVMASMDVGWSDLGSWASLLAALGAAGTGRVVGPGEVADAGAADLVVRRRDGALTLEVGPLSGILDPDGPSALLSGALADRPAIEALIGRVKAEERLP